MTGKTRTEFAHWLALLLPAALLAGAYGSQYIGGLYPCEMCWWQRYPHFAAVGIATVAFLVGNTGYRRALVALAALAIATSGLIGGFHAGVEYGWWEGLTQWRHPKEWWHFSYGDQLWAWLYQQANPDDLAIARYGRVEEVTISI